ncbi:MAG: hypothetical protein GQ477_00580 [Nanohaloarchaea archaeon]|nr:hypothetical protein [Candidatus Nanohaloarchaea archaeon]
MEGGLFLFDPSFQSVEYTTKLKPNSGIIDESMLKLVQTCVKDMSEDQIKKLIDETQTLSSIDEPGIQFYTNNMSEKIDKFNNDISDALELFYNNPIIPNLETMSSDDVELSEYMNYFKESVRLFNKYFGAIYDGNSEDLGKDILSLGMELDNVINYFDDLVSGGKFEYSSEQRRCCNSKFHSFSTAEHSLLGHLFKYSQLVYTTDNLNKMQEEILENLGFSFGGDFDRRNRTAKIGYAEYDNRFNS